ncbi:MAG: diguanylate cyclase/phosphodiesterase [Frankiales bacterium]|nr:diguanylate cyclase/phosphodiesterase [Frankiales bacterium]
MGPGFRPSKRLRVGTLLLALGLAAVLPPYLWLDSDTCAVLAQAATTVVIVGILLAGLRRGGPLRRCYLLLLPAMVIGLVSCLLRLGWQLATGDLPTAVWQAGAVSVLWVPFVAAALLAIPATESRQGFRVRALADGLLAAASLWYLLLGLGVDRALDASHLSGALRAQLLISPIGDVFLVATALTVCARCRPAHRPMVVWALAGLTVIGCGDVLFAIPEAGHLAHPSGAAGLLNELGLLLLVVGAASTAREGHEAGSGVLRRWLGVAGALPFAPLVGCVGVSSKMMVDGNGMPAEQLLPATFVALALMGRQYAGARDKERLVQALRARERDLEAEVRRDALTGLGNRTDLVERLAAALKDPAQWPVSVALLDLNDFKLINDNHGHETGDAVLVEVAGRLRASVRAEDVVARLGGDEFAVVATNVADQGKALGERLLRALEQPVHVGAQRFCVRASIGLVNGQECESPAVALACADVAMYEAKAGTRSASAVAVMTSEGRVRAERRLRLQEAVADPKLEQFAVVYQPVVDLRTGDLRGMEALLRWTHPELGPVSPDVFIPLAERAGTIGRLGDFAMTTALAGLAEVQSLSSRRLVVGVNVSPAQLTDPGLAADAVRYVQENGLRPYQLHVEITEQAFEADLDAVAKSVEALTAAGVGVAVDDFGTGYSSLQYLQRLPVGAMKIDRSFVCESAESPRARLLLTSIVSMAGVLDLRLVAEGIETEAQLRCLQQMGCQLGQGYLFSRPLPFPELRALVAAGRRFDVGPRDGLVPEARQSADEKLLSHGL